MRPPFLLLTVAMMVLVAALASYEGYRWSTPLFVLICLAALAAHLAVNLLNEYEDFESGLDAITQRTPFSGGSGALQVEPRAAQAVAAAGYFCLGFLITLGAFFVQLRGEWVLLIGLLGVVVIVSYTSFITRHPWLCLVSPGLAFGPFMIVGGTLVLTGEFSWLAFWVSWIPFLLVNNLLLLNQFPDEAADQRLGRFNIIMQWGHARSFGVFLLFWGLAYGVLAWLILLQWLPLASASGFVTLPWVWAMGYKLRNRTRDLIQLTPLLAMNVAATLLLPVLIAFGLYYDVA
ncbi:MAG: prenyltransferase [Hydrogenovibrio sp.]